MLWRLPVVTAVVLAVTAAPAVGEQGGADWPAATVAAVLGTLETQRPSGSIALRVGDAVLVGDRLRTRGGDRAKIIFTDDSVVDVGPSSELVVDSRRVDPSSGREETVLVLLGGQVRAVVPPPALRPGAHFEIETPAAVAFRGGEFFISYDREDQRSRVVALADPVSVAGKVGVVGGPVELGPRTATEVRRGRLPGAPEGVDFETLMRLRRSVTVVGTGRRDGLEVLHPAARGRLLAAGDVPVPREVAPPLQLVPPQESLADRLSADVRTNTEPLLEYERRRPGVPSVTGVEVEF